MCHKIQLILTYNKNTFESGKFFCHKKVKNTLKIELKTREWCPYIFAFNQLSLFLFLSLSLIYSSMSHLLPWMKGVQ